MKFKAVLCGLAAFMCLSIPASAASIIGVLNISGAVSVDINDIDWLPLGGGTGTFDVTEPGTGHFAGLACSPPCFRGTSQDLTQPEGFPGNPVPGFLSGFFPILGGPNPFVSLAFQLDLILAPVGAPCTGAETPGQSCSFGSFNLLNNGAGTTITLNVLGTWTDTGFDPTQATGRYTTQLPNSIGNILTTIVTNNSSIAASYSANFESVPEPTTFVLAGAGLLVFGMLRRRRQALK